MQFSSKDFHRTQHTLDVSIPEKLAHRQVAQHLHGDFSNERGHGVAIVDLPTKTISVTIGHLNPGQSTRKHRHNYETVLYVTRGRGYTMIEDRKVEWQAGDAIYVPVWAWHNHANTGDQPAEYLACENTPMLQNIGNIALRQEADI